MSEGVNLPGGSERRTRVVYEAIADFSDLAKATRRARRDLEDLRKEEERLNTESVKGSEEARRARERQVTATQSQATAQQQYVRRITETTQALSQHTREVNRHSTELERASAASRRAAADAAAHGRSVRENVGVFDRMTTSLSRFIQNSSRSVTESNRLRGALRSIRMDADRLEKAFDKVGNFKIPLPFVKDMGLAPLLGIMGTLLSFVNPLVAGIGAIGGALIGLASSAGIAATGLLTGLVPALANVLSMVGVFKLGFSGIGKVFQLADAAKDARKKAAGGGGRPQKEELTKAEQIARAQERLRRATEDVKFAQDDLNEARKRYTERIKELTKALQEAAKAELRLRANQQLARENLANVLADPGATKGEKMAARAELAEANDALNEGRKQRKEQAAELAKLRKTGVNGDRDVIMAKRRLQDAIWAQRDAEIDLANAHKDLAGAAGAAATAEQEFQDALAELSPSARKVVETLLGMRQAFDDLKEATQEAFFKPLVGNIGRLKDLLPPVQDLLTKTADAMGHVASNLIAHITTPEWLEDIRTIGSQNVPVIQNMGWALQSILDAFKDIAVAAGPFLSLLTRGIANTADEFARWIKAARNSRALNDFLMTSYQHLKLWWQIIKNLAITIGNFAMAAEPFARWITQGLANLTKGWADVSKKANTKNSPFQQWLERIKPLLRELGGLVGDFFKWIGRVSSNQDNIDAMKSIVETIRTRIGPALGRIFDSLSKVSPAVVKAIATVIEALAMFYENGGAAALTAFWTALSKIPPEVLAPIAAALVTMSLLKFTGILALIKALLRFNTANKAGETAFSSLGAMFSKNKAKELTAARNARLALPGAVRGPTPRQVKRQRQERWAGERWDARQAERAAVPGREVAPGVTVTRGTPAERRRTRFRNLRTRVATAARETNEGGFVDFGARRGAPAARTVETLAQTGGRAAKFGKLAPKATRLLKGGGVVGLIATVAGDYIADTFIKNGKGGGRDYVGNIAKGAITGAAWGSMFGPVGTAVGGVAGGVIGAATTDTDTLVKVGDDITTFWMDKVVNPISDWISNTLIPGWQTLTGAISSAWQGVVNGFNAAIEWVKNAWQTYVVAPFNAAIAWVKNAWQTYVVAPFNAAIAWVKNAWQTYVVAPFHAAIAWIRNAWQTYVVAPFHAAVAWVKAAWQNYVVNPFNSAVNWVKSAWHDYVVAPFQGIVDWIKRKWQEVVDFFKNLNPVNAAQNVAKKAGSAVGKAVRAVTSVFRAEGGPIPGHGTGDTVPAMLTPGEYVIRKSVVDRVGTDTLDALNSGLTSLLGGIPKQRRPMGFAEGGVVPFGMSGSTAVGTSGVGGIVVENLNINNPTPERVGDSLPRTIRKLSYLGRGVRPA